MIPLAVAAGAYGLAVLHFHALQYRAAKRVFRANGQTAKRPI